MNEFEKEVTGGVKEEIEDEKEPSYKVTHKFYIAGVQHHQMYKVMKELEKGFFLFLIPEPTNKYDPNAIKITFPVSQEDVILGYVPKRFSSEISAAIELDKTLECVIITLNKSAKPWEQCEVEIREFEGLRKIDKKICEIINGQFSYLLKVDGEIIQFEGIASTEYFESHYANLGYVIVTRKEQNV